MPPVPYQTVRRGQLRGAKRLGHCSLRFTTGGRTARGVRDCQPQDGRELGLEGKVNIGESPLSRREDKHA